MRHLIDIASRLIAARASTGEPVEDAARDVLTKLLPHPCKPDVFETLLHESLTVMVRFDARREAVDVPKHLRDQAEVSLRFGLNVQPPIADFAWDTHSVSGTLTFNGTPYHCTIPWGAVFLIYSEPDSRGAAWPLDGGHIDMRTPEATDPSPDEPKPAKARGNLKLVD